jgi:hypothetical protein
MFVMLKQHVGILIGRATFSVAMVAMPTLRRLGLSNRRKERTGTRPLASIASSAFMTFAVIGFTRQGVRYLVAAGIKNGAKHDGNGFKQSAVNVIEFGFDLIVGLLDGHDQILDRQRPNLVLAAKMLGFAEETVRMADTAKDYLNFLQGATVGTDAGGRLRALGVQMDLTLWAATAAATEFHAPISRSVRRAESFLSAWASLLPARIATEDIGDYIEDIRRRAEAGQRVRLALRVVAAVFWTAVNTVGYWRSTMGGKRTY